MKKLLLTAILALPLLVTTAEASPKKKTAPSRRAQVKWHSSMAKAVAESKRTGKPIFVDFYTTWCVPCKYLDAVTYKDARFVRESRKWVMIKLDAEKGYNAKIAQDFNVRGFPSMLFIRPNSREVGRAVGSYPAKLLVKKMKRVGQIVGGGQSI